jgi:hypothetical protein
MDKILPKNLDEDRLALFMEAIEAGAEIYEACVYSKIKSKEYIAHCNANPGWAEEIAKLNILPIVEGRISLRKGVKCSPSLALKYLERKKKDEFSLRQEHTGADGDDLFTSLADFLKAVK